METSNEMPTRVVHCKYAEYDVYIGRPSKWGNPVSLAKNGGDRTEVIEKYKEYLRSRPDLIEDARSELKGKTLGCWCAPQLCHGDILAFVAEGNDI